VADFSSGLLTRRVPLVAVTVVQAAGFGALLHERISPVQRLGVAVALVGVAVVSAA
jgi:drug/metabolite transporter (DMT)-like permease